MTARRTLVALAATSAALLAWPLAVQAQADAWPAKPIRIVVPFPPGGAVDLVGRAVGRGLSEGPLKAQVVIENRPGAGAMIGTEVVAKSPADGYTLLTGSMSALAVNPSLYKATIRYDALRDFAPVGLVATTPGVLAVNPKLPVNSIAQLVALAKSRPGMTYASSGNGNFQHLIGELFKNATGVNLVHVPYKGSAPALIDTIAGQVEMIFDVMPSAAQPIKSGQLRGLAVTSAQRSEVLPDLPTMAESGLKGFDVSSWYGIVAPAGTPAEVVNRLNADIQRMLKTPEMRAQLLSLGATPLGGTAAEFSAHLKSENARWAEVIRSNQITAN
ncbi:MAG: tripartite tricarboxylate transporter substrate binding protein [Betaproteobacteria bacterium]|nr:tripartite tricarboxylate transporter substrate binding protein [Betaproteobacteria bacterium]